MLEEGDEESRTRKNGDAYSVLGHSIRHICAARTRLFPWMGFQYVLTVSHDPKVVRFFN